MLTLLLYVLIVGLVAALLFLVASAVFGRGEELGPLPEGTTVTVLPAREISGSDVRALRFQQVVRGYKAGEVDWALTRLAARIDELEAQLAQTRTEAAGPVAAEPESSGESERAGTPTGSADASAGDPAAISGNGAAHPAVAAGAPQPAHPLFNPAPAHSAASATTSAQFGAAVPGVPAPRRVPAEPGPADRWLAGTQAPDAAPLPQVLPAEPGPEVNPGAGPESAPGNSGVSRESEGRGTAR